MEPGSQEKTAFATYFGLFEFRRMLFGLVKALATFQRLMETGLAGLARDVCLVYLDDVLVVGKTFEEHNGNLARVLERFREAGLKLKPKSQWRWCRTHQSHGLWCMAWHSLFSIAVGPDVSSPYYHDQGTLSHRCCLRDMGIILAGSACSLSLQ